MPHDISDAPADQQGKPRVVWRGDTPMVVTEKDGVATISKLTLVDGRLWNTPAWSRGSSPTGPRTCRQTRKFLAMVVELDARRREAIDALKDTLADLREARGRIAAIGAKDVVALVDKVGVATRDISRALDQ